MASCPKAFNKSMNRGIDTNERRRTTKKFQDLRVMNDVNSNFWLRDRISDQAKNQQVNAQWSDGWITEIVWCRMRIFCTDSIYASWVSDGLMKAANAWNLCYFEITKSWTNNGFLWCLKTQEMAVILLPFQLSV